METSRGLKLALRFALFGAVLTGIFWGIWTLVGEPMPSAKAIYLFGGETFRIDAIASRWWDLLGVAAGVAMAAAVIVFHERVEMHGELRFLLGLIMMIGVLVAGIGYSVWTSQLSEAPYMPIVFLVLSAAFGLVLGVVGVVWLKWQEAVLGAFLGPMLFGLSATPIGGLGGGFLQALVLAGAVSLVCAALSAALCLLTCAILKQGFWSGLGRWLIVKKSPAVAAPVAPVVEDPPSPERAYCTAVSNEKDALMRYEAAKAGRLALETELGDNAPKALDKLEERL